MDWISTCPKLFHVIFLQRVLALLRNWTYFTCLIPKTGGIYIQETEWRFSGVLCTSVYMSYMYWLHFFPHIQVEGDKSIVKVFQELLKKEGPKSLRKGMLASILSWVPSSVVMIAAYETVKKLSLKEDAIPLFS